MKLSTRGRYAVMAMADIGVHSLPHDGSHGDGEPSPVSLAEIADRQEISLSYLEQLFAKLRRSGLVKSVRGPGGGYRLGHQAGEIRIADIIGAVDEPMVATRCIPGLNSGCVSKSSRCLTHDLWDELGNQIRPAVVVRVPCAALCVVAESVDRGHAVPGPLTCRAHST